MPDRKLRVFLCHSSQDKPIVREPYQRLSAVGWIDPWLDEEKLLPGQDWDIEIEKAVEAADTVIVCLSNNSVTKEGYVQRELRKVLEVADEKPEGTLFIIPLRLEDCGLPRRLRSWQYVDYFPVRSRKRSYERLLTSLQLRAKSLGIRTNVSRVISVKAEPIKKMRVVKTKSNTSLSSSPATNIASALTSHDEDLLSQAHQALSRGKYDLAFEKYDAVFRKPRLLNQAILELVVYTSDHPKNINAWMILSNAYESAGKKELADIAKMRGLAIYHSDD